MSKRSTSDLLAATRDLLGELDGLLAETAEQTRLDRVFPLHDTDPLFDPRSVFEGGDVVPDGAPDEPVRDGGYQREPYSFMNDPEEFDQLHAARWEEGLAVDHLPFCCRGHVDGFGRDVDWRTTFPFSSPGRHQLRRLGPELCDLYGVECPPEDVLGEDPWWAM